MKIGFIGCGKMGQALLEGALNAQMVTASDVFIGNTSPESSAKVAKKFGANAAKNNSELAQKCQMIMLGCKPYQVLNILEEISPALTPDTLILSIAAGITLPRMESACPEGTRMIRVMPNTPSLIGDGASGIAAGCHATDSDLATAKKWLESVGMVEIVTETQLHAVTGLSGSGPAYVYTFIENLAAQAEKEGLPLATALRLATQTVLGAARMVEATGATPSELRNQVTSPGGTTLAGLDALTTHGFETCIAAGVHAATERSREIAAES